MFKLTFVFVIIVNFVFKRIVFQMKMVAIGGVSLVFLCAFKLVNVYFTHYHFYPFPGLKTKFSEKQISILPDAVNNVSKEQISKSTSALPVTKKMEAEEPIPIGEVLKSKEGFQVHKKKKVQLEKLRQRTRPNPRTIFSLADYKPGKSSKPLKYGLDLTLTRLNMEFGRDEQSAKANVASRYFKPSFSPKAGKSMEMVGGIKVGQDVPNHSARHVLVLTTWRSGSTFLGDLLNHYKGTFYYFEPLHYYSKSKNNPSLKNPVQNETDFLKSLYHCQFDENNLGFLHHVSKSDNKFLFKNHNFRLWNSCEHLLPNDMMCLMPEYLNKVCPKFPIKLIKTVRLQMRNIEELITDATLGLKVIFLVRDPRGTYNSRSSGTISKWCIRDECANPAVGCEQLLDNVNVSSKHIFKTKESLLIETIETWLRLFLYPSNVKLF